MRGTVAEEDDLISNLLLWTPAERHPSAGRPVITNIHQKRWMIGSDDEKGSGNLVLSGRLDKCCDLDNDHGDGSLHCGFEFKSNVYWRV